MYNVNMLNLLQCRKKLQSLKTTQALRTKYFIAEITVHFFPVVK
jgi:hypothetical protein